MTKVTIKIVDAPTLFVMHTLVVGGITAVRGRLIGYRQLGGRRITAAGYWAFFLLRLSF